MRLNTGRRALLARGALLAVLGQMLTACSGRQSALDPQGPAADAIAQLAWIMFAGAGLVLLLVTILLVYGLFARVDDRRPIQPSTFIAVGGVVLPIFALSALLIYSLQTQSVVLDPAGGNRESPLRIRITGHQWWWHIEYLDREGVDRVVSANELHLPTGRNVELQLESGDVIHTFWVPSLAGKLDMIPGHTNVLKVVADRPGLFRGQCNEFCGDQHALMSMDVITHAPVDFKTWLDNERDEAREPDTAKALFGKQKFMTSGCARCHRVRGTDATGTKGPDLTHFGSRRSIAAATLKNTLGNRMAWISSAQHIKPESNMPNYRLDSETLHAISLYLGTLE